MDIYLLRDYIGVFAPAILFILTLFLLRNMKTYLRVFVYGFILNNILNIILKLVIKEPRPSNDKKIIEIAITNGIQHPRISFDKFGMPSGHAQNCGYCLAFVTMVMNDPLITAIYAVFSSISLYQRYLYNNHTILQLAIGISIGLAFGYLTYLIGNKYIMGNIKMKKDDYGPF
jgi:membrane-associated phospholipid phosphatase